LFAQGEQDNWEQIKIKNIREIKNPNPNPNPK
jgi:hypothetical protein